MESNKNTFYALLGASVAAMIGGVYMIYKNFKDFDGEYEEDIEGINKNVQKTNNRLFEENNDPKPNLLTTENIAKIYAEISKNLEEFSEVFDSESAKEQRRHALKLGNDYWVPLASELLSRKHLYFEEQKIKILKKYNIATRDFENIIRSFTSYIEVEKELFKIYKPKLNNKQNVTKEKIKEMYCFHCKEIYDTLNSDKFNSNQINPEEKTYFMLIERVKIDDELFFKYGLTFNQVKYYINFYNLYNDEEVKCWFDLIPS